MLDGRDDARHHQRESAHDRAFIARYAIGFDED